MQREKWYIYMYLVPSLPNIPEDGNIVDGWLSYEPSCQLRTEDTRQRAPRIVEIQDKLTRYKLFGIGMHRRRGRNRRGYHTAAPYSHRFNHRKERAQNG